MKWPSPFLGILALLCGTMASAQEATPLPSAPDLDDPMLVPVPAPARFVSSWAEALTSLQARSLDLRIAYDQVRQAEGQSRIALAAALPSLNASATGTQYLVRSTATTLQAGASLVQPLLNIQAWHAIGTAHVSEEAAGLSVVDLKRTLTLGMANALVGVVAAERVAELNRVGLRNALAQLLLARTKFKDGAATALDVERTQQNVDNARATLVTGDESLRQAREALGLALGLPEAIGVTPTTRIDDFASGASGACKPARDLRERRDIQALAKQEEVAARNVTEVYDQFLPIVNLQSNVSTATVSTNTLPPTLWNVQAVFSWNIWDGGARYGQLRNARAVVDEAKANEEGAERNATILIAQARRSVDVATAAAEVAGHARDSAASIDRMTQQMFRAGAQVTSLDLVLASAALREAEITLVLRQFDLVKARLAAALTLSTCSW